MTNLPYVDKNPSQEKVEHAAQIANAEEFIVKMPEKYQESVGEGGGKLSGGQKQRVAIVRALCMNPEIMLFDEVTASLDPEMVREVLDVMLGLAKEGMTMIIVTHEMNFARAVADRVIFIDEGKIVETASPDEFFQRPQTQRARKFLDIFEFPAGELKEKLQTAI